MENATVITGQEDIQAFRMLAMKGALKLESLGMKRRGMSICSVVKKEFGIKGKTVKEVYQNYCDFLLQKGILQ